MNRYIIIGIVVIAAGTIMMGLTQQPEWMIAGGVINGFGLFVMAAGSLVSTRKDKIEILGKIQAFREEITTIKETASTEGTLKTVERVEDEFTEWAGAFISNLESKVIDQQKNNILLKENEISLSKKWRHIYVSVCEILRKILTAYNDRTDNKIEFTIPDIPFDLYGQEAKSYNGIIAFDNDNIWMITLRIIRPLKQEEIPNILVSFFHSESSGKSAKEMVQENRGTGSFLLLDVDNKEELIRPHASDFNMRVGDIKESYSIKPSDYKSAIIELFTALIEHQLVDLVEHQKSSV